MLFPSWYNRRCPLFPLYSDGPLSSRPQPRGSDGDVTPRKDTREDLGPSFLTSVHHVVLQGGFNVSLPKMQQDQGDFGSRRSKPHGGVIQPGSWLRAGTHWPSVGNGTGARTSGVPEIAGTRDTGGRTGNIAEMLGPRLPVDVPAALRECRGQGTDPRAGTPRKGDQPKDWRATDPRTGGHHPKNWSLCQVSLAVTF